MKNIFTIDKFKKFLFKGFKYGKILGVLWLVSLIIISPILFLIGGWKLLIAYLICKITGACPI